MCFSGVCKVYLQQKCGAEMVKMRCGNGKIVVYLRRIHAWFPAFRLPRWRNGGAMAVVGGVVTGFSCLVSL